MGPGQLRLAARRHLDRIDDNHDPPEFDQPDEWEYRLLSGSHWKDNQGIAFDALLPFCRATCDRTLTVGVGRPLRIGHPTMNEEPGQVSRKLANSGRVSYGEAIVLHDTAKSGSAHAMGASHVPFHPHGHPESRQACV